MATSTIEPPKPESPARPTLVHPGPGEQSWAAIIHAASTSHRGVLALVVLAIVAGLGTAAYYGQHQALAIAGIVILLTVVMVSITVITIYQTSGTTAEVPTEESDTNDL